MTQIFKDNWKIILTGLVVSLFAFSACSLTIPPDWDWEPDENDEINIVILADPDDAQVLLNGKWIGDAYEFAAPKTALRLTSRNNELVIKRQGYVEEPIDLYNYSRSNVTIRLKLKKDRDYKETSIPTSRKPSRPQPPPPPKKEKTPQSEYEAKTEPQPSTPPETVEKTEAEEQAAQLVDITLEISPAEASIYIEGVFFGISPAEGKIENLRLKKGKYTLDVFKPGYKPFTLELTVKDTPQKIKIILVK